MPQDRKRETKESDRNWKRTGKRKLKRMMMMEEWKKGDGEREGDRYMC